MHHGDLLRQKKHLVHQLRHKKHADQVTLALALALALALTLTLTLTL
jgi:hypothetical protein